MKQKLRLFAIYQTATSLQRTYNMNPKIKWYMVLDETNWVKSTYFTIHLGKNLLHKMVAGWNWVFYFFMFF